jgi:hypothetical protein
MPLTLDEVCAATGYHRKYATALFGKSEAAGQIARDPLFEI